MNNFCIYYYFANNNPSHHNDENFTDEGQKEVYFFCRDFMKENKLETVIDVGCGSGYKLIHYLGNFKTTGIETEPCYSMLCKNYPDRKWLLSGEAEQSFIHYEDAKTFDVVICADVIEHIVNPDSLIDYLLSFKTAYYIISTPCRNILCHHPKYASDYKKSWNGPLQSLSCKGMDDG